MRSFRARRPRQAATAAFGDVDPLSFGEVSTACPKSGHVRVRSRPSFRAGMLRRFAFAGDETDRQADPLNNVGAINVPGTESTRKGNLAENHADGRRAGAPVL